MKTNKILKLSYFFIVLILFTIPFMSLKEFETTRVIEKENLNEFYDNLKTSQDYRPFSVGTSNGPHTLEIVDAWDSDSNMVLEQVVETLFAINLTDLDLPRINLLAESYSWANPTTLHIKLREGILFHDGTSFNADAAKWNLDRLQYLINATGTKPYYTAQTKSLWCFPDGVTPIMNNIVSNGAYNITITLNAPYGPFLNTLTYINAGMISPTFHASDAESFIPLDGDICGTGPFIFDDYIFNEKVDFHAYEDYWRGKANISEMTYIIFDDATTAHNAFLNNEIDWNLLASDQNIEFYKTIPNITVYEFSVNTGKPSLVYQFMGVNNNKYNSTWRKAFTFAMNYSYVIDELRLGKAFRSYSAISPGFGGVFNTSLPINPSVAPNDGDITVARATMQSMGFGLGLDIYNDDDWITQAETAPFKTVRYTYNLGNTYREDLGVAITEWLKLIGCATEDDGVQWDQFLDYLYDVGGGIPDYGWDHLELYAIGWLPDYLEPYNILDPLFNPISGANNAQVDDAILSGLMADALDEPDTVTRCDIYKHIQSYLATRGFNHIPLYHSLITYAHSVNLTKVPYNAMDRLYFYPCEWVPQLAQEPIYEDTIAPIVKINNPEMWEEFTTNVILYDIEIIEENLDTVWYTINDGQNIIITSYIGYINENTLNALPNGLVTLDFYANDTAGNVGSDVAVINKNISSSNGTNGIPGSSSLLIIMIILFGIIGLSWRDMRKNKIK